MLNRLPPRILDYDVVWRKSTSPAVRFAITLRFLAIGDCSLNLQYICKVVTDTICKIIPGTCEAITNALQNDTVSHYNKRTDSNWQSLF